jgi:hypothetical protein
MLRDVFGRRRQQRGQVGGTFRFDGEDVDEGGAVGYLVKRVQQSVRRQCDAALRPSGLSSASLDRCAQNLEAE